MTSTATYMYALTRRVGAGALADLPGVSGAPVRAIEHGELTCLVSTVDLAQFGEQALAANLEDLGWLERTAREHDEVVRAGARLTTTMPLRLATICNDDASVHARLGELSEQALAVLTALDGCEEWGVKLYATGPEPDDLADEPPSGTAYLLRRRQQLARDSNAATSASRDADAVYRRLLALAVDGRRHRPQDRRLTGATHPMVLNAAFLVERDALRNFRAEASELAAERPPAAFVLTGPWPAYSFTPGVDG